MGWSGPRNVFQLRMVSSGRLLFEGQEKGRDERPSADHDEERQAGNSRDMPELRHQDLQDRQGLITQKGALRLSGLSCFRISDLLELKMEGYCLKDKKKVEMKDPQPI